MRWMRSVIRRPPPVKGSRSVRLALTALALLASYIEEVKIGMQHIGETTLQLADGTTKAIADANILDMMDYFQVTLMNRTCWSAPLSAR